MQIFGEEKHIQVSGDLFMILPFEESKLNDLTYLRTFHENVDNGNLHWHRDREDRIIEPTHPTDWTFQIDNELPKKIDEKIFVPKGVYHRLIKGTGDLVLKVTKIK
jgi:hypothetical protein